MSEEHSGRAERGPELVIKEKCRWGIGGNWGVEKVISVLFSIERRPQFNPQNHSPQGYYEVDSTLGMNLIVQQTFVDCDCGILIVQVKASEYLNDSFIFNILNLHTCTC